MRYVGNHEVNVFCLYFPRKSLPFSHLLSHIFCVVVPKIIVASNYTSLRILRRMSTEIW